MPVKARTTRAQIALFAGPGTVRARCREIDWSRSALGAPDSWPQSLRTALSICFNAPLPTFIWWGRDLIQFHNDAALELRPHRAAQIGVRAADAWVDVWDDVRPIAKRLLSSRLATPGKGAALTLSRRGATRAGYFRFSFGPLLDERGTAGGVFITAVEATARIEAQRELRTERRMSDALRTSNAAQASFASEQAIAIEHLRDFNDKVARTVARLRDVERHRSFLLELSDALRSQTDPHDIYHRAATMLGEHLKVNRVICADIEGDVAIIASAYVSGAAPLPTEVSSTVLGESLRSISGSDDVFAVDDVGADARLTDVERAACKAVEISAIATVTLARRDREMTAFCVQSVIPRLWTRSELRLIRDVAFRTREAVDRANASSAMRDAEGRQRDRIERDRLRQQLLAAEEEERRRLARELHDEAGQHLTALGLGLQALSDVTTPGSEIDRRASRLRELAARLAVDLHDIALRLRPKSLDDFGLEAAITAYAEDWSRTTHIPIDVQAASHESRLPASIESAIYRIVQEALTNVARHSGATGASVIVYRRDGDVVAIVEDNGVGFEPSNFAPHPDRAVTSLGLLGIRERVTLLGGTVEVESAPGAGTTIYVRLPVTLPMYPTTLISKRQLHA
jgi:signal transduction histidine kinase